MFFIYLYGIRNEKETKKLYPFDSPWDCDGNDWFVLVESLRLYGHVNSRKINFQCWKRSVERLFRHVISKGNSCSQFMASNKGIPRLSDDQKSKIFVSFTSLSLSSCGFIYTKKNYFRDTISVGTSQFYYRICTIMNLWHIYMVFRIAIAFNKCRLTTSKTCSIFQKRLIVIENFGRVPFDTRAPD